MQTKYIKDGYVQDYLWDVRSYPVGMDDYVHIYYTNDERILHDTFETGCF